MESTLTADDQKHLASLDKKLNHVRDVVRGIAMQFHAGCLIWGEGGTSKSFTVGDELQKCKAKYILHNSRITGRGLVDALQRAPNDIHWIEDAETLMEDKKACGVLRSALWARDTGERPLPREITWTAHKTTIRFQFTGGVIVISNANLTETVSEFRALKTRINVLRINVTNDEVLALMKKICRQGYAFGEYYLSPAECWEVAGYIIQELNTLKRNLDLRLLRNGFGDMLQWKAGEAKLHWKDLLRGRMAEEAGYKTRADAKREEAELARAIHEKKVPYAEKMRLWAEQTSRQRITPKALEVSYYRALKRLRRK